MGNWRFILLLIGLIINQTIKAQKYQSRHENIQPNILVLKLKSPSRSNAKIAYSFEEHIQTIESLTKADHIKQVFPLNTLSNSRSSKHDLQNIYKLKLHPGTDIWKTISRIQRSGLVEYVEPLYQNDLLYTPNDPEANPSNGQQTYLEVIRAYEAWDIEKSDTSMVIGIVDTGVNIDHEDLGNIAFNHDDPINGIDDDSDGYIDNFHGWDIADNNSDPTADGHPHGSPVTGMSSASTNNGIGMAGAGFKSRYLPVKIAETSSQKLTKDYEGVKYAADHGAKVINLSWGGAGNYSQYGQDIINYAVLEKDAVVVAAAGNTDDELDFYPASFDNVLSVGASDINDNKASWATYSYYIDLLAPCDNVFTTKNNGGYEITTGSSFASPLVAGSAALVRSRFPELNAIQVMEQLRVTSDDIYQVGQNMNYNGQLGKGRLNMQRALSDVLTPSVRLSHYQYNSNHNDLIFPGDTVEVQLEFTNYLRKAENLTISVSCTRGDVNLQSEEIYISSLEALESYTATNQLLTFIVSEENQPGDRLFFRIDYLGNYYEDFQYFEIPMTPDYFDISDGNITATISSDGDIGYDDDKFKNGNGIAFGDALIATNSGLIISHDKDHVVNNVINDFGTYTRDHDFYSEQHVKLYDNSIADFDCRSVFRPYDTIPSVLPIRVEQKVLTWQNSTENGFIIFEYRIINTGDSAISGLNAGLFADWDLGEYKANAIDTDETLNLGYAFDKSTNNQYAGLALLSNHTFSHYAIDLFSLNGNSADLDTIFSDSLKHNFLNSVTPKLQAGTQGAGNDVAHILGAKEFDLPPKEAGKITIAMLSSTSLEGLKEALALANEKYLLYQDNPPVEETFYACLGDSALLDPAGEIFEFYQDLNLTQRLDSGTIYLTPPVEKDTFYYAINLDSGYSSNIMKFNVRSGNPTADFVLQPDTLLIESGEPGSLNIKNTSLLGSEWYWDFGNGYNSTVEHPVTYYENPGTYQVDLIASNEYGCVDTLTQELLVAIRSERPELEDQDVCKHSSATISASNTNQIKVYSDAQKSQLIYHGDTFETGSILRDTTFFIANSEGEYESVLVPIQIFIDAPKMGFEYSMDTTDLANKYSLSIENSIGQADSLYWYIDGIFTGRNPVFNHLYPEQTFEISQIKISGAGCKDTLRAVVVPRYSPMPNSNRIEVCGNSNFEIKPQNGKIFYFYADESKTQLIHKGRSLTIPGIEQSTTFFVTNVDSLLESATAIFEVDVSDVKAQITTDTDSILLENAANFEIINSSQNAIESFWLNPTGTFDTTKVLYEHYGEIGSYDYQLVAIGTNGCSDTTYQRITVFTISGIEDKINSGIKIYPTPTSSTLTIEFDKIPENDLPFELVDISGRSHTQFTIPANLSSFELPIEDLPNGIYFIRSLSDNLPFNHKVIKQ
jgi:subtilisin family serine protease/PKD repeat protein